MTAVLVCRMTAHDALLLGCWILSRAILGGRSATMPTTAFMLDADCAGAVAAGILYIRCIRAAAGRRGSG